MGMFDYVNFEMDCPKCGALVTGFQSKSANCDMMMLDIDCVADMYGGCRKCGNWIRLSRAEPTRLSPRDEPYTLNEARDIGFNIVEGK